MCAKYGTTYEIGGTDIEFLLLLILLIQSLNRVLNTSEKQIIYEFFLIFRSD